MTDEAPLKAEIYRQIEPYASTGVPKKIAEHYRTAENHGAHR